ncbi:hypothetical protein TrRE_jg9887 [Triparma retinervis]|uniref:Uncharacterized protein n=1 Tax=Triparma retinervis TaxID=2557542 RepID=A0A9W7CAG5_9STRA|nr:hypothetical protein TrRE_jg9887 [Triparma retinervis]
MSEFPSSYYGLLTSIHQPLTQEDVAHYFDLTPCRLSNNNATNNSANNNSSNNNEYISQTVDEEAFNDLLNTNPSVITSFHFPPIQSVALSSASDSSYDIVLSSSDTVLNLPESILQLLLSSISISTYPNTFHQPSICPDPSSTHAFARVIPLTVHDVYGVECIVKNSTNAGMSRAFKGSKLAVSDLLREGREEAKKYYQSLLETPLAHTLLSFPLAVSLHPKLSALPSFGSMLPRQMGERWKELVEGRVKGGEGKAEREWNEGDWEGVREGGKGVELKTQIIIDTLDRVENGCRTIKTKIEGRKDEQIGVWCSGVLGVNVIESCQTDMSHACNAHFSQISSYNSGIKNALGVLRKAGRLGEEAKAVDEEGDVVEMAEGMAREARDNFQDSMKDAMAYIRRGMRVAAQELASGEIDRVSDAKRRWEDLRNIAGFSDEEIEESRKRIDRVREAVQLTVQFTETEDGELVSIPSGEEENLNGGAGGWEGGGGVGADVLSQSMEDLENLVDGLMEWGDHGGGFEGSFGDDTGDTK